MTDHEQVFNYFVDDVRTHGGETVRSVVAFGSALTGEFRPGASDYNFLLVVDPIDLALLDRLAARIRKWERKRISVPLVLAPEFLATSLDSYPLEFLSILAGYRVLYGEDPVGGLVFQREHVRLQCEREIRSKMLLFRRAYLASEGAPKRLKMVVERGLPSLVAIFRGLLYLKEGPWKARGEELWKACAEHLGFSEELLRSLDVTRSRGSAPSRTEVRAQVGQILDGLLSLARQVDRWS